MRGEIEREVTARGLKSAAPLDKTSRRGGTGWTLARKMTYPVGSPTILACLFAAPPPPRRSVTETQHGLLSGGLLHHPQQHWGGGGVKPGEIPRILGQRVPSGTRRDPRAPLASRGEDEWWQRAGASRRAPLPPLGVPAGRSGRLHHSIVMQSASAPSSCRRQLNGDYLPRFRGSQEKKEKYACLPACHPPSGRAAFLLHLACGWRVLRRRFCACLSTRAKRASLLPPVVQPVASRAGCSALAGGVCECFRVLLPWAVYRRPSGRPRLCGVGHRSSRSEVVGV